MEKMSRMSKYKDLREGIKKDVVSDQQTTAYTSNQEPVKDADYYKRYLASEEEALSRPTKLKNAANDDTLLEPMTLDTVNSQVDEELERALSKVRQESGQEDYNTRMDILNKIRQSKMIQEPEEEETDPEEIEDEEDEEEEEDSGHRFGFFKRHRDDDEEEEEEDDEEEEEEEPRRKRFGFFKRHDDEEDDDEEEESRTPSHTVIEEDEDDEDEENSTFVKILNVIIVILGLVLIGLIGYIVKEFFF